MQNSSAQILPELTDEALVEMIGNGTDVLPELLSRYRGLVLYYTRLYAEGDANFDDYQQEGVLGLLSAAVTYRSSGAAAFRTYAAVCIRNRIHNAVRILHKRKKGELSLEHAEGEAAYLIPDVNDDPEQEILAREWARELDVLLSRILSKQEREIFCYWLSGLSYREIAARVLSPQKSVDNAIQRARRKLRSAWSELN